MEILAFLDEGGQIAPFTVPGFLVHYRRADTNWAEVGRHPLDLARLDGIRGFRLHMEALLPEFQGIKIVLTQRAGGTPPAVLASLGFTVWESQEPLALALEKVHNFEKNRQALQSFRAAKPAAVPSPQPVGPESDGRYSIDLDRVSGDKHIPTKNILAPFLEKGGFRRLEVLCSKPPCWLDVELPKLGLGLQDESFDGRHRVIIEPLK